jgi:signal transduction histidine kinase
VLLDSRDRLLYQWGDRGLDAAEQPRVELALKAPLAAWRLRHYHPDEPGPGAAVTLVGVAAFLAVAGVVAGLSVYFYRESTRESREAAARVRFVNQVSHELRTPLTNIRLYAELLEQRLGEDDQRSREQLGVIVAECHRLSRLIGNVLTFARHRRGRLKLRPVRAVIDDTVAEVVRQFRPALAGRGVEVVFSAGAPEAFAFDRDAVEQVLGNLLSNVEKYAASGGAVELVTRQLAERVEVRVADQGPGIPATKADTVFEPFTRLSDRLSDGVAGTGIGLSISREIARLHGGDLRLQASEKGACFVLELPVGPGQGGP